MKKSFPHNSNEKDIQINELPCRILSSDEKERFIKFRKDFNRQRLPSLILCLVITLFAFFLFAYNLMLGLLPTKEILPFSFLFLIPLICTLLFYKSLIPSEKPPKRVQIGRLKGIWRLSRSSNKGHATQYLDVVFPNGTRYRKVITSLKEQQNAKQNSNVLVISFDNKNAYGCILD